MKDRAGGEREPRRGDFAQVAKSVVDEATRDREDEPADERERDEVDAPKKGAA